MQVKTHKIKLKIGKYTSLRSKHTQNQAQNWEIHEPEAKTHTKSSSKLGTTRQCGSKHNFSW